MHRGWRNTFWQHRKIKIFSEEVRVTCEKKKHSTRAKDIWTWVAY